MSLTLSIPSSLYGRVPGREGVLGKLSSQNGKNCRLMACGLDCQSFAHGLRLCYSGRPNSLFFSLPYSLPVACIRGSTTSGGVSLAFTGVSFLPPFRSDCVHSRAFAVP
jgi:hypothetical protein